MCATITDRQTRSAALVPVTPAAPKPAAPPVKKPRRKREPKRITDAQLLDLAPLLASGLPDEVCPLCGFPRVQTEMCCDHGEYVVWECDLCRGSVRRADLIRRKVIHPFLD